MGSPDAHTANVQIQQMKKARSQTTFSVPSLTSLIHGGLEAVQARRAAWSRVEAVLGTSDASSLPSQYAKTSREDLYQDGLRMGKAAWDDQREYNHKLFEWITPRYTLANYSPFGLTTTLFGTTIELMGTQEQKQIWLVPAIKGEINGAYAQTELGHGSFVRGLETTAIWDAAEDGFVLNSPTLTSTKFWPGSLGFSATHAVVMAQLVIGENCHGVHPFVVRLRDQDTGKPAEGMELGDIGPKPSYNQTDNGYARFNRVFIPRNNMLMGHATVSRQGQYRRNPHAHPKAAYGGMMRARSKISWVCSMQLAAAVTIAVRYSIVRLQGAPSSAEAEADDSFFPVHETAIFQYRTQHSRLLTQLSRAYAILFASRHAEAAYLNFKSRQNKNDFSTMTETHALLAGIKAWATGTAADGAEDARKACGGAGYLMTSGLPEIVQSVTVLCTLEGENYVLWQQVARFMVKWASRLLTIVQRDLLPRDLRYLVDFSGETCQARGRDFLDPNVQLAISRHRARWLVAKVSRLMLTEVESKQKTLPVVWNENAVLFVAMARAHVDHLVLGAFVETVAAMSEQSPERRVLSRLCSLYALSTVVDGHTPYASASFTEDGFLSEKQIDDIRAQVNGLLDLLVPDAIGLTDAWDFTDAGLGSAIGMKDGNVYETLMNWTRQLPMNVAAGGRETGMTGWEEYIKPALKSKL